MVAETILASWVAAGQLVDATACGPGQPRPLVVGFDGTRIDREAENIVLVHVVLICPCGIVAECEMREHPQYLRDWPLIPIFRRLPALAELRLRGGAVDERVKKLKTPAQCETFAKNAIERGVPQLAIQALQRSVELRADLHEAKTSAERAALRAVYAYEEVLAKKNGKRTRATRTWQMIERHGIIKAVERAVTRSTETMGYTALVEMGLEEFAFESVVLNFPEFFSDEALARSRERLSQ